MKNKGPLPPTCLFIAIVAMAALHFLAPAVKLISFPWTLSGIVPFAVGIVLNLLADRAFKIRRTTVKPFKESSALVTGGVFRITRHPMYLGFVMILIGIALFMGSVTPFGVALVFAVLMDVKFIRIEERMLEEKFGELWLKYRREVRRWI